MSQAHSALCPFFMLVTQKSILRNISGGLSYKCTLIISSSLYIFPQNPPKFTPMPLGGGWGWGGGLMWGELQLQISPDSPLGLSWAYCMNVARANLCTKDNKMHNELSWGINIKSKLSKRLPFSKSPFSNFISIQMEFYLLFRVTFSYKDCQNGLCLSDGN